MFRFISYIFCGYLLYLAGNLIHERYVYISDRRAWLEQAKSMACTSADHARLLAHLKSDVLDPIRQRVETTGLTPQMARIEFELAPFDQQSLSGEPFGMPICTEENFPWRQRKGGFDEANCSLPAYLHCGATVIVKVPADIAKESDLAARYLPLRQYSASESVGADGHGDAIFRITADVRKTVPRYALSRMFAYDQRDGKIPKEFGYNLGNLNGMIENWIQFHEKQEQIGRSYLIDSDIGGAATGGGYLGSINKLKNEQIQLP